MHSVHRTGLATWRRRNGRTSSALRVTPASTSRTTGTLGSVTGAASSSGTSRAPAGPINEQWNGALTGSITLIFPPRSVASATARSTAVRWPAMTIWSAEFTFAISTTSPCAASAHTCSTAGSSSPMIAAIAPVPTGTASCMNSPRLRTIRTASANCSAPATTSAVYSPRLFPAVKAGRRPRSAQAAATATDAVSTAGWVLAVGDGLLERDVDRRGAGVAVAVDVDEHAVHRQVHPLGGGLDDPEVRLMRDEQAHVVGGEPVARQDALGALHEQPHGHLEDLVALHLGVVHPRLD